jgi:hypothetical protein
LQVQKRDIGEEHPGKGRDYQGDPEHRLHVLPPVGVSGRTRCWL